jgi:hypothetical protein
MREKGTLKTGGREKGTPNKITTDLREFVQKLLDDNRRQIKKDLKALEPHQRVAIYERLLSYALPKMSSVEAKIDFERLTDEQVDTVISEITKNIDNE